METGPRENVSLAADRAAQLLKAGVKFWDACSSVAPMYCCSSREIQQEFTRRRMRRKKDPQQLTLDLGE